MKYRKQKTSPAPGVVGMLHVARVGMRRKSTGEEITVRLLLVGCESGDIERKIRWLYDQEQFSGLRIEDIEKVRDKVHVLSQKIEQERAPADAVIERAEGTQEVRSASREPADELQHWAIALTTRVYARDTAHAFRKIGSALVAEGSEGKSQSAAKLSDDAVLTVEPIGKSSRIARARDVSNETNTATFVRG